MLEQYDLIIFDLDGTLADRDTSQLLPGVLEWFRDVRPSLTAVVVIASNQGGVGLRYWMESQGFGEPEKYPTARAVTDRLVEVMNQLEFDGRGVDDAILAFAYQSKKSGEYGPIPGMMYLIEHREFNSAYGNWETRCRKPAAGMLFEFTRQYKVWASRTLMVGDSEEDRLAAAAAGCNFVEANTFFNR